MAIQSFKISMVAGCKYWPDVLMAQAGAIVGATQIGLLTRDAVRDAVQKTFYPSDSEICDIMHNFSLLEKVEGAVLFVLYSAAAVAGSATQTFVVHGILQDVLLTRVPKMVLGIFGRGHWMDSRSAQVLRVGVLSTMLAASAALDSAGPRSLVSEQVRKVYAVGKLGLGIASAVVKEKTGSVLASVGVRSLNSALIMAIQSLWLFTTHGCS
ncbi:MAG TPA: hypothetical protein VLE95_01925 [Chlamydiales bacterium]|nr:hypothetical protein [Chlamydiales bacterium]